MLRVARALRVKINFTKQSGEIIRTAEMPVGSTLLQAAHKFNLDVEGACGGECACATCHMILPENLYESSGCYPYIAARLPSSNYGGDGRREH